MKVLLIAEHGSKLGGGHLSRLFSIAEWLSDFDLEMCLYTNSLDSTFIEMFRKLKVTVNLFEHPNEIFEKNVARLDFCILDGDHFPEEIDLKLREKKCCRVIRISDRPIHYSHANYLINQNLGSETFGYRPIEGQVQKFGLQQLMLRKDIRLADTKARTPSIKRVVISFGNSKSLKTTQLLQSLIRNFSNAEFSQLQFLFFVSEPEGLSAINTSNNIEIQVLADNFIEFTQRADFLITSVGTTMWEAMAMGVSFAVVPMNFQQSEYASVLSSYKICDVLEIAEITQEGAVGFKLLQKALSVEFSDAKKEKIKQLLPKTYFSWLDEILNI